MTDKIIPSMLSNLDTIFHYTKKETAMENILSGGVLKLSKLADTDDPHQYKRKISCITGWEGETPEGFNNSVLHEAERIIQENMRVCCFCRNIEYDDEEASKLSKTSFERYGFFRMRMWSQYTIKHKGICLAFSQTKLMENVKKDNPSCSCYSGKVSYSCLPLDFPEATTINIEKTEDYNPVAYAAQHIKHHIRELVFTKHIDYKEEYEYRICVLNDNISPETPDFIEIEDSLVAIIAGDDFPEIYIPILQTKAQKYKVQLFQLHWEFGEVILSNRSIENKLVE